MGSVYEGNEKYLFISYAHKDSPKVLPILEAMQKNGFRLWYDRGIEAGTEWPAYIEDHLRRSDRVLAFLSKAAVASRNCRNEINFALKWEKELLVVYLEPTALYAGMDLQLGSMQSFFMTVTPRTNPFCASSAKPGFSKAAEGRRMKPPPLCRASFNGI